MARVHGHGCNKRLQNVFVEKQKKRVFNVFYSLNVFYFQQVKVTQITFPDFSNIGNILNIKNNGI